MFYQRTWTFYGINDNSITVKKIKLGYMRVKVKDEGKYYTVWDFIGDWLILRGRRRTALRK